MSESWQTWVVLLEAFGLDGSFTYEGELPEVGDVIEVTSGDVSISARVVGVDAEGKTHQIEASEVAAA